MSASDIFGTGSAFTEYEVAIQVRGALVGGVPSSPSVIRNWLESRLEAGDIRLEEIFHETVESMGAMSSMDEKLDAVMQSEAAPSINGFKRTEGGLLAYEGRCLKAAIKEWANSSYPGVDWDGKYVTRRGPDGKLKRDLAPGCAARKGLLSTLAERVFVNPRYISLGVSAPDYVEERVKHVMTPQGPKSAIGRVEVLEGPLLEFTVRVRDDFLPNEAWSRIWQTGEEIGIGADRGRSDGRFDLIKWSRIS